MHAIKFSRPNANGCRTTTMSTPRECPAQWRNFKMHMNTSQIAQKRSFNVWTNTRADLAQRHMSIQIEYAIQHIHMNRCFVPFSNQEKNVNSPIPIAAAWLTQFRSLAFLVSHSRTESGRRKKINCESKNALIVFIESPVNVDNGKTQKTNRIFILCFRHESHSMSLDFLALLKFNSFLFPSFYLSRVR